MLVRRRSRDAWTQRDAPMINVTQCGAPKVRGAWTQLGAQMRAQCGVRTVGLEKQERTVGFWWRERKNCRRDELVEM